MYRLAVLITFACASAVRAEPAAYHLERCTRLSELVLLVVEARRQHDDLETAIREIPDMPEVQELGFGRSVAQNTILHVEPFYASVDPGIVSAWMMGRCANMVVEPN